MSTWMGMRALATGLVCAVSAVAQADAATEVDSRSVFQVYEVQSPSTRVVYSRQRLIEELSLRHVRALGRSRDPRPVTLTTEIDLRLEQDFGDTCLIEDGTSCTEATDADHPGGFQPLARDTALQARVASVELSGLPGQMRVRLGRQWSAAAVGFARVDGARFSASPTPWFFAEGYGGALVRQSSVLGISTLSPVGLLALDLESDEADRAAFIRKPLSTWMLGWGLELGPRELVRLRADWRTLFNQGGTVDRRLRLGVVVGAPRPVRLAAHALWNLLTAELASASLQASVPAGRHLVLASIDRTRPVFDQSTIWGFFDLVPVDRASVAWQWQVADALQLGGSLFGRRASFDSRTELDAGIDGDMRFETGAWRLSLRLMTAGGDLGPLGSAFTEIRRTLAAVGQGYVRFSAWHFDDPLRNGAYATSLSETLGAVWDLSGETSIRAEVQHAHSRLVGHRLRAVASLHVGMWR